MGRHAFNSTKLCKQHCNDARTDEGTAMIRLKEVCNITVPAGEMVVLCNLRLPELDKNRNIDQQKALIFNADSCNYDLILGADSLSITGIDVKYSTETIEWFDNELPLRDTRTLQSKDFLAMADIIDHTPFQ
jgi:hypothetical protein